nr:NADH dehydrogenase subunit 6 [Fenusa sp. 1 GYN-2023a]
MNKIMIMMMFMNTMMFYSMKTPLSMGFMLMIQTLTVVISTGMLSFNFWYSYMLFLVMIGGLIIMFIYLASLSSNMKFKFNMNHLMKNMIMTMMIFFLIYKMNTNFNMINYEMMNMIELEMDKNMMMKMSLMKLYNKPTNLMMILIINYLLITMFIIVKITNIKMGPLRKKY